MKTAFLGIAAALLFAASSPVFAQTAQLPPYENKELTVAVHNSGIVPAGASMTLYQFEAVAHGELVGIQNLAISTQFGDILCGDFGDIGVYRPASCSLVTNAEIEDRLELGSASGTINGKKYDLTANIKVDDFAPLTLELSSGGGAE